MSGQPQGKASNSSPSDTHAGFVALVGRPNVGKSTLLNAVLGEKLAIVSPRPQTTRNRILGVRTDAKAQMVLLDTPGIHRTRANMNRFMVQEALDALDGVDCVVLITEVSSKARRGRAELNSEDEYVLEQVRQLHGEIPLIVVLNKIDLLRDRRWLLPLIEAWSSRGFSRIVPMSAQAGDGVDRFVDEVQKMLPAGPHLYPEEMFTDRAERFLVAEFIREQVFLQCHEEVPFATAVEVERFEERPEKGDVMIEAAIHVEREGQKAIIIGAKGSRIKEVGTLAREEISGLIGCTVHLKLVVRVSRDWTRKPTLRRRFGYE
ncbi:MAG: GTPase Era [Deltaproteobacteria bacterium]|nr:GTPase Era [Deltaproteobacteria bacterium]